LDEARKEGVTRVRGSYIPTKKNKPCEDFLSNSGFKKEREYWVYSFDAPFKMVKHLELIAG
jgi:predicted enzyme involved in methoxymalonyl-ACP biosynthesis